MVRTGRHAWPQVLGAACGQLAASAGSQRCTKPTWRSERAMVVRPERGNLTVPIKNHAKATRRLLQRDRHLLPGGHGSPPPERGGRGLREQRQRSSQPERGREEVAQAAACSAPRTLTCQLRSLWPLPNYRQNYLIKRTIRWLHFELNLCPFGRGRPAVEASSRGLQARP